MSGLTAVSSSFHITSDTSLMDALEGWKMYLRDKGRSEHTVKAFAGDLQLFIKPCTGRPKCQFCYHQRNQRFPALAST